MSARAPADASRRRNKSIIQHIDHAPLVEALIDDLYAELCEMGTRDYEVLIEAEYATHGERVRQDLMARGAGSLPITWVYPPEMILTSN